MALKETNPLFLAVMFNNLRKLQSLLRANHEHVNAVNFRGRPLLQIAIEYERVEIFDYLMSFDNINVNCVDYQEQQTPYQFLMTRQYFLEVEPLFIRHFVVELVKKGADVSKPCFYGRSYLHEAAKYFTSKEGPILEKLVVERGMDVNARDWDGLTALHIACNIGNSDCVYMLLYYGANARIYDCRGELPLVTISKELPIDEQLQMQEILFNYTFDDEKTTIELATLVKAMTYNTPVFWKILEIAGDVNYDMCQLKSFLQCMCQIRPECCRVFIKQFDDIAREIVQNFHLLEEIKRYATTYGDSFRSKEMIQIFLESDLIDNLIQPVNPTKFTIAEFIYYICRYRSAVQKPEEEEEVTKMVCIMLTYGVIVTYADLNFVYERYGFCELFKILLHMDIDKTFDCFFRKQMISLYYNPSSDITDLDYISLPCDILEYYNHPKIKDVFIELGDEEKAAKAKSLPSVPLLVELSRNIARKYITSKYNIKTCRQFYSVLNRLPIGDIHKSIIALEKKLY